MPSPQKKWSGEQRGDKVSAHPPGQCRVGFRLEGVIGRGPTRRRALPLQEPVESLAIPLKHIPLSYCVTRKRPGSKDELA